jgi:hypothetical protein
MIWVHGPRYLQAMYPDHEKLAVPARAVTGLRLFALDSGRAVSGGPYYYGAQALAGALWPPYAGVAARKPPNAAWPLPQHAISRSTYADHGGPQIMIKIG